MPARWGCTRSTASSTASRSTSAWSASGTTRTQFAEAGITAPPATWDDFLADVQTLKDAGITPIALAGKDTWTGAFYWAYLAVRECGQAGMDKAVTTGDWTDPCFVKAGERLQAADRPQAIPGRLPGCAVGRRRQRRRRHGDRQRCHPADGPVAAGHGHRQLGGSRAMGDRPRLVPVPGGRRRRRRSERRPRRRQRLRGRQGRAARDGRLPALPGQPRRRKSLGRPEHRHPADHRRHRGVGHRPVA